MSHAILPFGRFAPELQPGLYDPPPLEDAHKLRRIIKANAVCGYIIIEQRVPRLWPDRYPSEERGKTISTIIPATVRAVHEADKCCDVRRIVPNPQRADFERAVWVAPEPPRPPILCNSAKLRLAIKRAIERVSALPPDPRTKRVLSQLKFALSLSHYGSFQETHEYVLALKFD